MNCACGAPALAGPTIVPVCAACLTAGMRAGFLRRPTMTKDTARAIARDVKRGVLAAWGGADEAVWFLKVDRRKAPAPAAIAAAIAGGATADHAAGWVLTTVTPGADA